MNMREQIIEKVRKCKTLEEVYEAMEISPLSAAAYYVELLWEALKK